MTTARCCNNMSKKSLSKFMSAACTMSGGRQATMAASGEPEECGGAGHDSAIVVTRKAVSPACLRRRVASRERLEEEAYSYGSARRVDS